MYVTGGIHVLYSLYIIQMYISTITVWLVDEYYL